MVRSLCLMKPTPLAPLLKAVRGFQAIGYLSMIEPYLRHLCPQLPQRNWWLGQRVQKRRLEAEFSSVSTISLPLLSKQTTPGQTVPQPLPSNARELATSLPQVPHFWQPQQHNQPRAPRRVNDARGFGPRASVTITASPSLARPRVSPRHRPGVCSRRRLP